MRPGGPIEERIQLNAGRVGAFEIAIRYYLRFELTRASRAWSNGAASKGRMVGERTSEKERIRRRGAD